MTCRAKLIILGMALLLLAVPVGYLVLSWHLHEPLRFRVTGRVDEPGVHYDQIEMANASCYPVRVYSIDILDPKDRDNELDYLYPEVKTAGGGGGISRLSGRDTMPLHGQENTNLKLGGMTARSRWNSETRHQYCRALSWLQEKLPDWLVQALPEPSIHTMDVQIEPQHQVPRN